MVLTIEEAQSEVAWAELVTERVEFEVETEAHEDGNRSTRQSTPPLPYMGSKLNNQQVDDDGQQRIEPRTGARAISRDRDRDDHRHGGGATTAAAAPASQQHAACLLLQPSPDCQQRPWLGFHCLLKAATHVAAVG
jgi:hypothetical protein